jgi:hypothetical protein
MGKHGEIHTALPDVQAVSLTDAMSPYVSRTAQAAVLLSRDISSKALEGLTTAVSCSDP